MPVARLPKLHAIHSLTLFLVRSRRSMEALNCTKDASALRARGHARKTRGPSPTADSPCTGSQSGSATRDRGGNKQASIFSTLTPRPVMCASVLGMVSGNPKATLS